MGDYAHNITDERIAEIKENLFDLYDAAASDLEDTIYKYFEGFKAQDAEMSKMVDNGTLSKTEYQQWRTTQLARGEQYNALQDKIYERMDNANQVAMSYINDATPGVYSLARNYSAYTIEQYSDGVDFNLWDEATVRRLIVDNPQLLPNYPEKLAVNRGLDLAYSNSIISNCIQKGILTGASLDAIASDLLIGITGMNRNSAMRAARTAMTAAENGGREDCYMEAAKMGLRLEKVWLATLDNKTRPTHQAADGQTIPYNACFDVGNDIMRYPGDPMGSPGEVYNCRCTMYAKPPSVDMSSGQRWSRDIDTGQAEMTKENISYNEWITAKRSSKIGAELNAAGPRRILTVDEVIAKIKDLYNSDVYSACESGPEMRAATNKVLGYDALPTVQSKAEFKESSKGKKVLYRGVTDGANGVSAQDIVEEMRSGRLWTGASGGAMYGNGMYFSGDTSVANEYAGRWSSDDDSGAVATAYLKDDAKIVSSDEIIHEYYDYYDKRDDDADYRQDYTLRHIIDDVGQYAAMKGYDAIQVPISEDDRDIYVILNRGEMVVEDDK